MFAKNSSVTIQTKDFAMLLAMLPSCGWKTINGKKKSMEMIKRSFYVDERLGTTINAYINAFTVLEIERSKGENRNKLIDNIRTRNKDDAEDMEKAIKDIEEGAINKK